MNGLTRRDFLRVGGLGGAATILGGAAFGGAALAGPVLSAEAAVARSRRFDLAAPSTQFFRNHRLHEAHHAPQGFAFDTVNRRLFITQLRDGSSGDDLCINHLDYSGRLHGHMHLNNAGHGVSIGCVAVGSSSYLWVECDSDRHDTNGRGTALARFRFVAGARPTVHRFLTGSRGITCATDPVYRRLIVRRIEHGRHHYSVFSQAAADRGDFRHPLAHFAQPAVCSDPVFQGYTAYGSYLYTLSGSVERHAADINSYVTCVDMNTGRVVSRRLTRAGKSLIGREPEGMAIYRSGHTTRLMMGFSSRPSWGSSTRYSSLYYKDHLVG